MGSGWRRRGGGGTGESGCAKMHTLIRFTLVCACVFVTLDVCVREARCEASGAEGPTPGGEEVEKKEPRSGSSDDRRVAAPGLAGVAGTGTTRDLSSVLSLAVERRNKLLANRLNHHSHAFPAIAHKPYRNVTLSMQPYPTNANNTSVHKTASVVRNSTKEEVESQLDGKYSPDVNKNLTLAELVASENKSTTKLFHDSRKRAGFLNNKRKETEAVKTVESDAGDMRVEDTAEGMEQEAIVDPDEEFQVDESSHGIYFLNYTDGDNETDINLNNITKNFDSNTNISMNNESSNQNPINGTEVDDNEIKVLFNNTELKKNYFTLDNVTVRNVKETPNDGENKTLFMSDEIYNHFRPLESELRAEDMAQFLFFGQKLSTPFIDVGNLTKSTSPTSYTKSVNLLSLNSEKKKYTSRYSATEKPAASATVGEDEVNEDMDVSLVKNVIERNKGRNSVKGPVPSRHISLLNAYRKPLTQAITTAPTHVSRDENRPENVTIKDAPVRSNYRNLSRGYFNPRRRPIRPTSPAPSSLLRHPQATVVPTGRTGETGTTEKSSTLVYTAVVTSVSITSSMKGQNKTDTPKDVKISEEHIENVPPTGAVDRFESTTSKVSSTPKLRQRMRSRPTTERVMVAPALQSPTPFVLNIRDESTTPVTNVTKLTDGNDVPIHFASRGNFNDENVDDNEPNDTESQLLLDAISTIDRNSNATSVAETSASKPPSPPTPVRQRRPSTSTSTLLASVNTSQSPSDIQNVSTVPEATTEVSPSSDDVAGILYPEDISEDKTSSKTFPEGGSFTEGGELMKANEEVVVEAERGHTASYVLAGLGILPVTAVIVFALRHVMLRRGKQLASEYEGYFDEEEPRKDAHPPAPPIRAAVSPAKPDHKWEFPRNKLRLQTLLGQGNFGQVWKAEADDLNGHDGLTRLVAVKTIKDEASSQEKQELLHEICIMHKIGPHPNVVTLLACCTEQEPYLLVMEYVMCGKLLTYLRERRARPDRFGGGGGALTSRDLTVFSYCVARGMEYLASKRIVHRDLAARNVLVGHNKLCKIADFGMSRELSESGSTGAGGGDVGGGRQRHALPVRWMAPEALLYNLFNHETDVWAYGILLWEIVTLGSTPYAAMSGREVLAAVTEGYRLERPPHCKQALYRIMHACWSASSAQRPRFAGIKAELAELLDKEPVEGHYVDLDSFYQESSVYSDPSAIIRDDGSGELEYDAPHPQHRAPRRRFPAELASSPRMSGFGIREHGFGRRDGGKLSGASFQREREVGVACGAGLVSRHSFSGGGGALQRLGSRGREPATTGRVPEFECDI